MSHFFVWTRPKVSVKSGLRETEGSYNLEKSVTPAIAWKFKSRIIKTRYESCEQLMIKNQGPTFDTIHDILRRLSLA